MQNPASYQEAVHTVSLAARSRKVVNYVGLASKKETPKVKVDMEAKLRAWLDSKGKTKSVQRMLGPCRTFVSKPPSSTIHSKKEGSICSSAKDVSKTKGRLVFSCCFKMHGFCGFFPLLLAIGCFIPLWYVLAEDYLIRRLQLQLVCR